MHIAVLCKLEDLVLLMVGDIGDDQDINAVRDQFGRTALHYAYASTNSSRIIRVLINAGCTEAVFDMVCKYFVIDSSEFDNYFSKYNYLQNGRRPDDFKEMRGTPEMESFLKCLRLQVQYAVSFNLKSCTSTMNILNLLWLFLIHVHITIGL